MECGAKCIKYMLFAFNFLFWVLGIVVLGVGIYSRIKGGNYDTILGDGGFASAANILIASGVFVSLIGFVGCCGALKESKVMLIIYFILVLLIFILEIAAGALAYTKKDLMEKHLTENLKKFVHLNYGEKKPDEAQKAIDVAVDWFQEKVKCCGATGPNEWMDSAWRKTGTGSTNTTIAPDSCCKTKAKNCALTDKLVWQTGCIAAGKQFVKDHMWQVGGVGVGIAIIQLLVMIAAIALCRNISKEGNLA